MVRCSSKTVLGRRCKSSVFQDSLCWVHQPKIVAETVTCGICLDENSGNSLVLKCGHIFCKTCIYTWIVKKYHDSTCPMCRQPIDDLTFYDARTWGIETGELFYVTTVCYLFSNLEEIEQYYLTAFYNIIPGSRITNALFDKIYQSMIGDAHALDIIKKLSKITEVKKSLYRKSEHQDFSNVKRIYCFTVI